MKTKRFLTSLPSYIFTIIWSCLAFFILLNPSPTGEGFVRLSDFWESVIHVSLGGIYVICIMLDWQRRHNWERTPWKVMATALVVTLLVLDGLKILQIWLTFFPVLGVETLEIFAQSVGALAVGLLYMVAQTSWSNRGYLAAGE